MTTSIADLSRGRPLLVHSHLRWDFVWQRPQQLFSRFAITRDVLFVEEPQYFHDLMRPVLDCREPQPNLYRVIPRLPAMYGDSETASLVAVRTLLLELIGSTGDLAHRFDGAVQWFCTPVPAPTMVGAFKERAVVYDGVDERAQLRFAPAEMAQRERFLLARADADFTGLQVRDADWDHLIREMTRRIEQAVATRAVRGLRPSPARRAPDAVSEAVRVSAV